MTTADDSREPVAPAAPTAPVPPRASSKIQRRKRADAIFASPRIIAARLDKTDRDVLRLIVENEDPVEGCTLRVGPKKASPRDSMVKRLDRGRASVYRALDRLGDLGIIASVERRRDDDSQQSSSRFVNQWLLEDIGAGELVWDESLRNPELDVRFERLPEVGEILDAKRSLGVKHGNKRAQSDTLGEGLISTQSETRGEGLTSPESETPVRPHELRGRANNVHTFSAENVLPVRSQPAAVRRDLAVSVGGGALERAELVDRPPLDVGRDELADDQPTVGLETDAAGLGETTSNSSHVSESLPQASDEPIGRPAVGGTSSPPDSPQPEPQASGANPEVNVDVTTLSELERIELGRDLARGIDAVATKFGQPTLAESGLVGEIETYSIEHPELVQRAALATIDLVQKLGGPEAQNFVIGTFRRAIREALRELESLPEDVGPAPTPEDDQEYLDALEEAGFVVGVAGSGDEEIPW